MPIISEHLPEEIIVSATYGTRDIEIVTLSSFKFLLVLSLFFKFDHAHLVIS